MHTRRFGLSSEDRPDLWVGMEAFVANVMDWDAWDDVLESGDRPDLRVCIPSVPVHDISNKTLHAHSQV